MSQTTMKIDRDVLTDLRELATIAHRTPQKHLRYLIDCEKTRLHAERYDVTDSEQQARAQAVQQTEASEALEGYAPLSEIGGYAYELQQQWVRGEITSEEQIALLKGHHGLK